MDIKFGISQNDILGDQILVSLIASCFKSDIIFTANGDSDFIINPNKNQESILPEIDDIKITEDEDIIPNFLNGNK